MKILLITLNWVGKGTYWRALKLGSHLVRRGHSVSLMATAPQRRFGVQTRTVDGVTVIETPDLFRGSLRSGWDLWNAMNRINTLHRANFDIVHAFEARPTVILPALYLRHRHGIPVVMDWADWFGRGGSVEARPNPLVRTLLRGPETFFEERFRPWASGNTVICRTLRDKAVALGVPPESILILPNGADTDQFHIIDTADARQQLNLPPSKPVIAYLGSFFKDDAILLARALDEVHRHQPNVRLLVMGHCPFDIKNMVARPNKVIETGFLPPDQLNLYLAAADLCWIPLTSSNANRGRFPLKLSYYVAAGRPTVSTPVGDLKEFFQAPIGLLAEAHPPAFANVTLALLNDAAGRQAMGRHARHIAETQFNWQHLADKLAAYYQSVLREREVA